MIISVRDLKKEVELNGWTDEKIARKLKAIECAIRKYTNNNFQDRTIRSECELMSQKLYGVSVPNLKVGDTIQVSESMFNDGIYVIKSIENKFIELDQALIDESHALVTKVVYPDDVVDCALNLLEWSHKFGGKVGVKSETLSRHSVTYEDSATLYDGYPVGLLNCLNKYRKARF